MKVWVLGLRVWGLGVRVWGLWFRGGYRVGFLKVEVGSKALR